jgi:guanylate kinase
MKVRMLILSAPSGAGKSSFVDRICGENSRIRDTVTFTTRALRKGESEGYPYHFVTPEKFEQLVKDGFFVEHAFVHEKMYGTPWHQLHEAWAKDEVIIMDVDIQGAATFKQKFPDAVSIFIMPPSIEELRRRVIKRDGRVPADLEIRMANAEKEIKEAPSFDYRLVNDDFDRSYREFQALVEELLAKK